MNVIAIFVCAVFLVLLGSLWYSKMLFGPLWLKLSGKNMTDAKKISKTKMNIIMGLGFTTSLITIIVLSILIDSLKISSVLDSIRLGLMVWGGFYATTQLGSVLWEQMPLEYYIINTSYSLISIVISSIILALFI